MPSIGTKCVAGFNETLSLAGATEALWLTARPASEIRRQLKGRQLEALYESVFLRIFAQYEAFQEAALVRYMANYGTPAYQPAPAPGTRLQPTVRAATSTLYGGSRYLLWHDNDKAIRRSQRFLVNSPMELVLSANSANLKDYARVRHHIAHNSPDSKDGFKQAATRLTGAAHAGVPGRMLRAPNISDPLNQPKWIRTIVDDLASIVLQICP